MNAIPYFDYSLAPFWSSYQSKVIGVLERALREQSCSRYGGSCFVYRVNMTTPSTAERPGLVWILSKPSVR